MFNISIFKINSNTLFYSNTIIIFLTANEGAWARFGKNYYIVWIDIYFRY